MTLVLPYFVNVIPWIRFVPLYRILVRRIGFVYSITNQEHCLTEDGQAVAKNFKVPLLSLSLALNSHREKFSQCLLVWLFGRQ